MKLISILNFLLALALTSCQEKEVVNLDNLIPSPIVIDSLSNPQLEKVTFIQQTFQEVLPISIEETMNNFKRDAHPDNEIEIWMGMAKAYQGFEINNKKVTDSNRRQEAFKLIFMRSMMSQEQVLEQTKLEYLTTPEAKQLLSSY